MAEESERRIQKIMDKLYHAPRHKTPSSSSSGMLARAQQKGRWGESSSRGSLKSSLGCSMTAIGSRGERATPPCRPWDRGDLTRRLGTFKAMTWFGKPKAVSPINCARRGWVNVEMDTIFCEACGARLLFSTPSSWTQQQVVKVAAVFSLKLDSGHKLLCPWVDNICDESLALFPPTPAPVLAEGYKERSSSLLRLSSLPIISSSAIDYMRSPLLEIFLAQLSSSTHTLDEGIQLTDGSRSDIVDSVTEAITSSLYHQAQKIISLCGWEPRLLPYVVDHEDFSSNSTKKGHSAESPAQILSEQNHNIIICPSMVSAEIDGEKCDQQLLEHQYDPASVVLDCKLCGACVGLWAFATVPRPLELFNLVESPEDDGHTGPTRCGAKLGNGTVEASRTENLANDDHDSSKGVNIVGYTASKERSLSLNLTIAGGPPPTKQNFRPTISYPIVSRHLRAGFSSRSDIRHHGSSALVGTNQASVARSLEHQNDNRSSNLSESTDTFKRKRFEYESNVPLGSNSDEQPPQNGHGNIVDHKSRTEERSGVLSSASYCEEGLPLLHEKSGVHVSENSEKCVQSGQEDLDGRTTITEDAANGRSLNAEREAGVSLQPGESPPCMIPDISMTTMADEACENSLLIETDAASNKDHDGISTASISDHDVTSQNHVGSPYIAPSSAANTNVHDPDGINTREGDKSCDIQNCEDTSFNSHKANDLKNMALLSVNKEILAANSSGNKLKLMGPTDDTNKFDPIRQHRPFCPWIAPVDGEKMPGFKLTLQAIVQERDSSRALHEEVPSLLSREATDDPIASIRKLFASPPSKRLKGNQ